MCLCRVSLQLQRGLKKLANATKLLVAVDREELLEQRAADAQVASHNGGTRGCFGIVRSLSGCRPQPHKSVELIDGRMSSNDFERQQRWQEHFAEVFNGEIVDLARWQEILQST